MDLAGVDVAATVYIHRGHFRRAESGLESRFVDAAICGHCVDVTPQPAPGRRAGRPGNTVYTAAWHRAPPPPEGTAVELSVYDAGGHPHPPPGPPGGLQDPGSGSRPGRSARRGKPSPIDRETVTVLYEQLAFGAASDAGQDQEHGQDDDQEQEFVISPERQARLEELKRRAGELGRDASRPKAQKKGRGGPAGALPQRPGYRPRRWGRRLMRWRGPVCTGVDVPQRPGRGGRMSDEDSTNRPDAGALSAMYLETLRLRIEPEKFGVLADALKGFKQASEAGFDGTGFGVSEELFTDDVRREPATVLTMAATGRTDHQVVEVVEGDPSMGCMVVTAEVAGDPAKLAELRAQLLRMVEEGDFPE